MEEQITIKTSIPSNKFWDMRYGNENFAYGVEPNAFLKSQSYLLPKNSKILALGSGEGRNAIYLAKLGHFVHCVDLSKVGLEKTLAIAKQENLLKFLTYEVADLTKYNFTANQYDVVISIWCIGMSKSQREKLYNDVTICLNDKRSSFFIFEAYIRKSQSEKAFWREELEKFFEKQNNFKILVSNEVEKEVIEGDFYVNGICTVVQFTVEKLNV